MRSTMYIFFSKDCFIVSDGKMPTKNFKIDNFQDIVPTKEMRRFYNTDTRKKEEVLLPVNVSEGNYQYIPNTAVFQNIWNKEIQNRNQFLKFLKEEFSFSRIFKPKILLMIPDGSIETDKRCILDFLSCCGFDKTFIIEECLALTRMEEPHFTLTKSFRAITLSLIENGGLSDVRYFDHNLEDVNEIKENIQSMSQHLTGATLPVFLYGDGIDFYKTLGTVVLSKDIIENLVHICQTLRKMKKIYKQRYTW